MMMMMISFFFFFFFGLLNQNRPRVLSVPAWHLDQTEEATQGPLRWLYPPVVIFPLCAGGVRGGRKGGGESFRRWITWCIFNFPAVAPVQGLAGSDGNERWTGRRHQPQHLRHDVRRSLPEAGQEGARVTLCHRRERKTAEAGRKCQGRFERRKKKRHTSPLRAFFSTHAGAPDGRNGPSRQQGIITHPHLCSLFLYSARLQHLACSSLSLSLSLCLSLSSELHHK